jgi:hypothetical protein
MNSPKERFKFLRVFHSISAFQRLALAGIILLPSLATVGCSSAITPAPAASNPAAKQSSTPVVKVIPGTSTVAPGTPLQFSALVTNTSNTGVTWSASGGVITDNGLFTAPNAKPGSVIQIVATSMANSLVRGIATLAIASSSSSNGNPVVKVIPGTSTVAPGTPLQFSALVTNTSNTGVTWYASGGVITDNGLFTTPNAKPGSVIQIVATSMANSLVQGIATLAIASSRSPNGNPGPGTTPPSGSDNRYCNAGDVPNFGTVDGPASTPTACYQTDESSTPSPGTVTQISTHSKLQTALDNASCGDTLVLQAGQTYSGFTLPAKNCDANHYITIRSSALGTGLPPQGVRATPCNAGVASLPGRPDLSCASTSDVMARVAGRPKASQIINTDPGANYYRLVGLEVTDTEANGSAGGYYELIMLTSADHVIVDRCWIHGSPIGEDVKGVEFSGSSYIAVVDSYISDIHSKLSGFGADSSAIGSVTGPGPVKIVNNFLEAAGENVLWGGGASSTNVSDVEIRRNHMFKPLTWWRSSPTYFGTAFEIKNLFESKTGVRQFVEGNIFENNWAQAQKGTAILFTPKNQYGACPECAVHDIIFRYNIVRHSVNAIGMASVYATTCPGEAGNGTGKCHYLSGGLYGLSIHDNLLDDINESTYSPGACCSDGFLFEISTNQPSNWPHDIRIEHNTGFPVGWGVGWVGIGGTPQVIANFSFDNNLMTSGNNGFNEMLPGNRLPGCGTTNASGMNGTLIGCMGNTWTAAGNVFANSSAAKSPKFPGAPLPGGNFEAPTSEALGFVNFNNGKGGDYHLIPTNPLRNTSSDGKDPGADIDGLQTATAGVL